LTVRPQFLCAVWSGIGGPTGVRCCPHHRRSHSGSDGLPPRQWLVLALASDDLLGLFDPRGNVAHGLPEGFRASHVDAALRGSVGELLVGFFGR
jgi:hypothetical protein